MAKRSKNKNELTKKEQSTTTAYKMMTVKINNLEASLRKTQDESEKERGEKHELDKQVVLLEAKLKNNYLIELFKFLSSVGVGFSVNYVTTGLTELGLSIGIPSIIIYFICIVVNRK